MENLASIIEQNQQFSEDCLAFDAAVDRAKAEIFKMVCHMPAPGVEQDPDTAAAIYWDLLKGELSPENIGAVCRSAMKGSVNPDSPFRPTSGQLIAHGRKWFQRLDPVLRDPRLPPLPPPPEHKRLIESEYTDDQFRVDERERIAEQINTLAAHLRNNANKIANEEKLIPHSKYGPVVSRKELCKMDEGEREKHRIEALDYLESKYANKPLPPLSAELRAKLGAGIPKITE